VDDLGAEPSTSRVSHECSPVELIVLVPFAIECRSMQGSPQAFNLGAKYPI
jgi:hypothetical protein